MPWLDDLSLQSSSKHTTLFNTIKNELNRQSRQQNAHNSTYNMHASDTEKLMNFACKQQCDSGE